MNIKNDIRFHSKYLKNVLTLIFLIDILIKLTAKVVGCRKVKGAKRLVIERMKLEGGES